MPSILNRPKSRGGGKWKSLFAQIPLPTALTGEDSPKSLSDMLFGTDAERAAIQNPTSSLMNRDGTHFGNIDEVKVASTNSVKLKGRLYHPRVEDRQDPRKNLCVLYCSGSGGSAETYGEDVAEYYLRQGVMFLAVNYRGFGRSSGGPSESGLYDDAYAMYKFLKDEKGIGHGDILVHGYSLGGPIAASLAKTLAKNGKPVRALVLHSPMVTSYEAAADAADEAIDGQAAQVTKMFLGKFDTRDKLRTLRGQAANMPIRLISGTAPADQLDISARLCNPQNATSFLQDVQAMNFNNLTYARHGSDHFARAHHMAAANNILQTIF